MVGKDHCNLLRDIHRYEKHFLQINKTTPNSLGDIKIDFSDFFISSIYTTSQNKSKPCFLITRKGCEFIANKLTGVKGTEFTARYINRFHELEENNADSSLSTVLQQIIETQNNLFTIVSSLTQKISSLETTQSKFVQSQINESNNNSSDKQSNMAINSKSDNSWFMKMSSKFKLLENYFGVTRSQLYRNIFLELSNIYNLDTYKIQRDYLYENNLSTCYPMEPYESNFTYRKMIETIIDTNLLKFNLITNNIAITTRQYPTIFNTNTLKTNNKTIA